MKLEKLKFLQTPSGGNPAVSRGRTEGRSLEMIIEEAVDKNDQAAHGNNKMSCA